MRRAMTLIEMVFVIAIGAILSLATFKSLQALYLHSARSKAITILSLESQIVLDQIGAMLYERIPGTVIGYTPSLGCEAIDDLTQTHPVLEWIASAESESIERKYDSFADLKSIKPDLKSYDINSTLKSDDKALIFSGALENGVEILKACEGAFGWHGNDSNLTFTFTIPSDNTIRFDSTDIPDIIYEKYYLAKGAYAVTRGANIDKSALCLSRDLNGINIDDNTLLLFYNYRPWRGKTYCADVNGDKEGNVTILAKDVSGFRALYINDVIRIGIDMNRSINGSAPVHIVKQKAVF